MSNQLNHIKLLIGARKKAKIDDFERKLARFDEKVLKLGE